MIIDWLEWPKKKKKKKFSSVLKVSHLSNTTFHLKAQGISANSPMPHSLCFKGCLHHTSHSPPDLIIISLSNNQDFNYSFLPLILLPMFSATKHLYENYINFLTTVPFSWMEICKQKCKSRQKECWGEPGSLKKAEVNSSSLPSSQSRIFHCFLLI